MHGARTFTSCLILVVVITAMMGSINFFDDDKIARYLKEVSLMLIWIASLVIAISTVARQLPAEKESRAHLPPAGEAHFTSTTGGGQISRLLAGVRHRAGVLLRVLRLHELQPRAAFVSAELFPGGNTPVGDARGGHRDGAAGLAGFCGTLLERDHLFRVRDGRALFVGGYLNRVAMQYSWGWGGALFTASITPSRIWRYLTSRSASSMTGR